MTGLWITLAIVGAAPVLAHLVGWRIARAMAVPPGRIRDFMPTAAEVSRSMGRGKDFGRQWVARRRALERRLLRRFADGVQGAEAGALAEAMGEPHTLVESALAQLREEIPCRLRVTRGGALLHDFAAADLSRLRWARRRQRPARALLFGVAALANLGAAWPLLASTGLALLTLAAMWADDSPVIVGLTGLLALAVLVAASLLSGWLFRWVLRPLGTGPRIGEAEAPELAVPLPAGWRFPWEKAPQAVVVATQVGGAPRRHRKLKDRGPKTSKPTSASPASSSPTSSDSTSSSDWSLDGLDDPRGLLVVLIVVVLLAVAAISTLALSVWARGIWRAVSGRDDAPAGTSPTRWVRQSHPVDAQERLLPTNDLVMRLMRALRRTAAFTHPQDGEMSGRLRSRAADRGGWLPALDLVLHEGLSPAEAARVGAALAVRSGGEVEMTEGGELVFRLPGGRDGPDEAWAPPVPPDDLWEFIHVSSDGVTAGRRGSQPDDKLPVNLPGVAEGHLVAGARLVGGTVLMAVVGLFAVHDTDDLVALRGIADVVLPLMTVGAAILVVGAGYAARASVRQGARRDVRRAAMLGVRVALERGFRTFQSGPLALELRETFRPSAPELDEAVIRRELRAACYDLDLEPSGDVDSTAFVLVGLRARLAAVSAFISARRAEGTAERAAPVNRDEVIFDTAIEHDRVRAL